MTTDSNPSPKQFRLSTLLVAVVVCAVLLTICFVVTPRYIESAKLEHDRIWIQVTPAAQSILGGGDDADRYKIIPLRGISLAAASLCVALLATYWCLRRRHNRKAASTPQDGAREDETTDLPSS